MCRILCIAFFLFFAMSLGLSRYACTLVVSDAIVSIGLFLREMRAAFSTQAGSRLNLAPLLPRRRHSPPSFIRYQVTTAFTYSLRRPYIGNGTMGVIGTGSTLASPPAT